ncbi:MAG: YfiR family protein [Bacteroidetes bacterium]|nr:YfiR family protein [Bacteroidota bacterium]MBS1940787.1 YfiR family protein [Bacteroidota bacterium]
MNPRPQPANSGQPRKNVVQSAAIAAFLVVMALVLGGAAQREPDKDTTAIIQASYLYNIAKLVEWRDPEMRQGPFIIGVMGSGNLYQELVKKYATRSIGKQPIEVRKLPETAEVDRCHILFVPEGDKALLPGILKQANTRSTLVVTDFPDALSKGAVVNFIAAKNTLKYEISLSNAEKHRIDIGLTLKQLAERVVE